MLICSKQNLHTVTFDQHFMLNGFNFKTNIYFFEYFFSDNLATFLKRKMDSIEECAPAPKKPRYNSERKSTMVHGKKKLLQPEKKSETHGNYLFLFGRIFSSLVPISFFAYS